jgi:D-alanyl-D-alanine carboxypeptidase
MITTVECLQRFGAPEKELHMVLWDVPPELEVGVIPKRIYCHRLMVAPLGKAFRNIIDRHLVDELMTWDGCFNIRKKKGSLAASLHSWGLAIDINAAWNGWKKKPTMSKELVACFTDAGFEWGGNWRTLDGMHFQLAELPK